MNAENRHDPVTRNRLRASAARPSDRAPAGIWLGSGLAAMALAGVFAARSQARPAAAALLAAALLLWLAVARPRQSPFGAYLTALVDQVGDAIVLAPLAWPLAHGSVQEGAPAVSALGLVFVGAYAQVRSRALGYDTPAAPDGAPERSAVLAVGLLAPATFLEPALWIVGALGAAAAARVTVVVWKARGT
ncbi:MAG TPA: hypothetical protein VM841_07910 [Actinomycetota bacterium]|nr:hypothetical protein [Actinomycetota bacterium]